MILLIAEVLGTEDLLAYIKKYNMPVDRIILSNMDYYKKKNLKSFINSSNKHLANNLAIDLLSNMLVYD